MNESEFSARVLKCRRKLYCVAYSILWNDADCADAMQEAAAKAWTHRFGLGNEDYFETWLTRILINECKTLRRRQKHAEVELKEDLPAPGHETAEDMDLQNALKRLKEKYRLPLILHYQDGYTLKEISRMLSIGEGLVKSRLYQARQELKRLLGGEDQ